MVHTINCMPHLPLLGQYLGPGMSRPEGGAFDHMIIRCYGVYHVCMQWAGARDLMWPQGGALN